MARQLIWRWHGLTWLAGFIVLWALIYQNLIGHSPKWLDPSTIGRYGIGWPVVFIAKSASNSFGASLTFGLPQFLIDLVVCGFIFGGAVAAIERWARNRIELPPANLKTLGVITTTILGWFLLTRFLQVPLFIFLGWVSLSVVYLAIPCVAYSLVNAITNSVTILLS